MDDIISMSNKELTRAEVIQRLVDKRIKQHEAASMLGLSLRQVKRLLRSFRKLGPAGLISKQRGKPSNHQLSEKSKLKAIKLLKSTYPDFGPTLASEKLLELHNIKISVETVRKLMIESGLWKARRARKPNVHQLRQRRSCLGELVQIDGSPHDWFEGRAPRCSLLVFIDDATGKLLHLRFVKSEATFTYFDAVGQYLPMHGKPRAFYSDKFSVFRPTYKEILKGEAITQFARAMKELDIEIICANTPQAKGRVERANQTLQDRLVKEMRLKGISSIEEANNYLPHFIKTFNEKFAVVPTSNADAHRPLLAREDLEQILVIKETRVLSKNLTLSYNRVVYQIVTKRPAYTMRKARVEVCENSCSEISIFYKGKKLDYHLHHHHAKQSEVKDSKQLAEAGFKLVKKNGKKYIPPSDHSWRRFKFGSNPSAKPEEQK
jgi:transposase